MQDWFLKLGASQSCELCTTTIAPYTTNMLRELLAWPDGFLNLSLQQCMQHSECLPSLSTGCSMWPLESRTPVCSLHRPIATSRLLHPDIHRYWVLHTLSVGAAYTHATSCVIVSWQIDFSIGLLVTCASRHTLCITSIAQSWRVQYVKYVKSMWN